MKILFSSICQDQSTILIYLILIKQRFLVQAKIAGIITRLIVELTSKLLTVDVVTRYLEILLPITATLCFQFWSLANKAINCISFE